MIELEFENKELKARIKEDLPEVGFYLYVWKLIGDKKFYDYLQNDLVKTKNFAHRKFGIPIEGWKKVKDIKR